MLRDGSKGQDLLARESASLAAKAARKDLCRLSRRERDFFGVDVEAAENESEPLGDAADLSSRGAS